MSEQPRFPMPNSSDLNNMPAAHAPTIPDEPKEEVARAWAEDAKPKAAEKTMPDSNVVEDLRLPVSLLKTKVFIAMMIGIFVVGILFGAALFGGGKQAVVSQGLSGVVENPDAEKGLRRCGYAPRGERCVLYVMNNIRKEIKAQELFKLVSQLASVSEFLIQTANVGYASTIIRPGYFAQFVIPDLKN
ncbi:MAG: hypothetical protein ILP11_01745 [Alphaproteobacteria bacterium]|nr:hypothetical protein [Alphaproteobacteria bacterium]